MTQTPMTTDIMSTPDAPVASSVTRTSHKGSNRKQYKSQSSSQPQSAKAALNPEMQGVKDMYGAQFDQLKDIFSENWSDEDLLAVLQEAHGDLETSITRIAEGHATQWTSTKKPTKSEKENVVRNKQSDRGNRSFGSFSSFSSVTSAAVLTQRIDKDDQTGRSSSMRGGRAQRGGRGSARGGFNDRRASARESKKEESVAAPAAQTEWPGSTWGAPAAKETAEPQPVEAAAPAAPSWGQTAEAAPEWSAEAAPAPKEAPKPATNKSFTWAQIVKPEPPKVEAPPAKQKQSPARKAEKQEPPAAADRQTRSRTPSPSRIPPSEQQQQPSQSSATASPQRGSPGRAAAPQEQPANAWSARGTASPRRANEASTSPQKQQQQQQQKENVILPAGSHMADLGVQFGSLSFGQEEASAQRRSPEATKASETYQPPSQTDAPSMYGSAFPPQHHGMYPGAEEYGMYGGDSRRAHPFSSYDPAGYHHTGAKPTPSSASAAGNATAPAGLSGQHFATASHFSGTNTANTSNLNTLTGQHVSPSRQGSTPQQQQQPGQQQPQQPQQPAAPTSYNHSMNMYNPYYPYYMPANQFAYPSSYGQPYMNAKMNNMYTPMYAAHPSAAPQTGANASNASATGGANGSSPNSGSNAPYTAGSTGQYSAAGSSGPNAKVSGSGYANYNPSAYSGNQYRSGLNEYDESAFAQPSASGNEEHHQPPTYGYGQPQGQPQHASSHYQTPSSIYPMPGQGPQGAGAAPSASASTASSTFGNSGLNASSSEYSKDMNTMYNSDAINPYRKYYPQQQHMGYNQFNGGAGNTAGGVSAPPRSSVGHQMHGGHMMHPSQGQQQQQQQPPQQPSHKGQGAGASASSSAGQPAMRSNQAPHHLQQPSDQGFFFN